MNPTIKRYIISSATTFVTVAATVLAAQLSNGSLIMWTQTFWVGVLITVVRAGIKAVIEGLGATPS